MTLSALEYFRVVAKYENMSKAALELHVSQPAISKTIKQLEQNLGCELFIRKNSSISLSKQGKILLNYCNKIFSSIEGAKSEIAEYNNIYDYTLDISVQVASNMFYDIIKEFSHLNPKIKYNVTQSSKKNTEYDITVFTSNKEIDVENATLVLIEKIKVAVPINHNLAKYDKITIEQLKSEFFVLLNQDKPLRKMLDIFLAEKNFKPNFFWETDNPEMCRNIVESGIALSFFPSISWKNYFSDKIKLLEISDFNLTRYVYILLKNDGFQTKSAINFKDFVTKFFIEYKKNLT